MLFKYANLFFVDSILVRVFKNNGEANNFFPNEKPMYLFSSIWNVDDWDKRGGLEKTDWKKASFPSSYKDFGVDGCQWEDPSPTCLSIPTQNCGINILLGISRIFKKWIMLLCVEKLLGKDYERYPTLLVENLLSPWDWWAKW